MQPTSSEAELLRWLAWVYGEAIAGSGGPVQAALAARWLRTWADGLADDPWLACAVGDLGRLQAATLRDPGWVHRPGGPLRLPPLVAVTHSGLLRLPAFRARLHACAQHLLAAGADPDQSVGSRCPPASLQAPATDEALSALYGAAGRHHDPELTRMLLAGGADPNDGESLYHALESRACTRLLLEAGARVTGSNALYRCLDFDALETLQLLLAHHADANEPGSDPAWNHPLLWAIRRRRSPAHVAALLAAGANPGVRTPDGTDAATLAVRHGLPEVAALLGASEPTAPAERFAAACARGDEAEARALQALHPALPAALPPALLRLLPELAAQGCAQAVQCMVRLGWPLETRGGDWDASALNHAIFRGDAQLARFLLAHGARWTTRHGQGGDGRGTLAWASLHRPEGGEGDWVGCAQALRAHGLPPAQRDPRDADVVLLGGQRYRFADEVAEVLLAAGLAPSRPGARPGAGQAGR